MGERVYYLNLACHDPSDKNVINMKDLAKATHLVKKGNRCDFPSEADKRCKRDVMHYRKTIVTCTS